MKEQAEDYLEIITNLMSNAKIEVIRSLNLYISPNEEQSFKTRTSPNVLQNEEEDVLIFHHAAKTLIQTFTKDLILRVKNGNFCIIPKKILNAKENLLRQKCKEVDALRMRLQKIARKMEEDKCNYFKEIQIYNEQRFSNMDKNQIYNFVDFTNLFTQVGPEKVIEFQKEMNNYRNILEDRFLKIRSLFLRISDIQEEVYEKSKDSSLEDEINSMIERYSEIVKIAFSSIMHKNDKKTLEKIRFLEYENERLNLEIDKILKRESLQKEQISKLINENNKLKKDMEKEEIFKKAQEEEIRLRDEEISRLNRQIEKLKIKIMEQEEEDDTDNSQKEDKEEEDEASLQIKKKLKELQERLEVYEQMQMKYQQEKAPGPTGKVALVFTDIQGSTRLWEKSVPMMKVALQQHNDTVRRLLKETNGYEVKTDGDSFMCTFQETKDAVRFSLKVQEEMLKVDWSNELLETEDAGVKEEDGVVIYRGFRVRIGIHSGRPLCQQDPVTKRTDYFGPVVNLAARVEREANGGIIAISEDAWEDVKDEIVKMNVFVKPVGLKTLKGVEKQEFIRLIVPAQLKGRNFDIVQEEQEEMETASELKNKIEQLKQDQEKIRRSFRRTPIQRLSLMIQKVKNRMKVYKKREIRMQQERQKYFDTIIAMYRFAQKDSVTDQKETDYIFVKFMDDLNRGMNSARELYKNEMERYQSIVQKQFGNILNPTMIEEARQFKKELSQKSSLIQSNPKQRIRRTKTQNSFYTNMEGEGILPQLTSNSKIHPKMIRRSKSVSSFKQKGNFFSKLL